MYVLAVDAINCNFIFIDLIGFPWMVLVQVAQEWHEFKVRIERARLLLCVANLLMSLSLHGTKNRHRQVSQSLVRLRWKNSLNKA